MNKIPIEMCERKKYDKTMKLLKKDFEKRGLLRLLDNFIKFKKQANDESKEDLKPKSKLSFDVSTKLHKNAVIKIKLRL